MSEENTRLEKRAGNEYTVSLSSSRLLRAQMTGQAAWGERLKYGRTPTGKLKSASSGTSR